MRTDNESARERVAPEEPIVEVADAGDTTVMVGETDREKRERNMVYHHQRLNHVRASVLNDMVRSGSIKDGIIVQDVRCDACQIGRATRRSHSSRAIPMAASKAGSWMQFDLLGPLPPCGFHNYKYVFAGIDTSSGFVFAHFLQSKTQVDQGYTALRAFMRKHDAHVREKHGHPFEMDLFWHLGYENSIVFDRVYFTCCTQYSFK